MEDGAELIERVRLICGARNVLTDTAELLTYRSDGLWRTGPLPLAVALPGDGAEVASVVRACAELAVPWTVRGAGTSTDGSALSRSGALLIALARMRRILSLNLEDDEVTVEPGVPAALLARRVAPSHHFPAETVSTVGGIVAQGAGVTELMGLSLVGSGGARAEIRAGGPGYDIAAAFPGSCGEYGIAVALTLRLVSAG